MDAYIKIDAEWSGNDAPIMTTQPEVGKARGEAWK